MPEARRLAWVRDGSPFTLMRPARDLRDLLRRYGYTVYDLGDRRHLEHEPPEDHTPYSETGYPGQARYGVGYAIDIMPPDRAGLPSLQRLGAQLLADRKAGVPGISWLKYMNWEPQGDYTGPCYQDSWRPTYRRRSSSDRGHIHLSGLTGFETSAIGAGYDPVARLRGDDMSWSEDVIPTPKEVVDSATNPTYQAKNALSEAWANSLRAARDSAAARQLAERAAAAAERAAVAAERAAAQTPQPIDYDRLALALLRNMAAPQS